MSKTIKISQEDLERIVENIVKEQEWKGSTDPEIMQLGQQGPEEIPGGDEYDDSTDQIDDTDTDGIPLRLGKDPDGNFYVIRDDGGESTEVIRLRKK